jgi:hypothetical protein
MYYLHDCVILQLSEIQQTKCLRRVHKVIFYLGGETFTYKYRACKNRKSTIQSIITLVTNKAATSLLISLCMTKLHYYFTL